MKTMLAKLLLLFATIDVALSLDFKGRETLQDNAWTPVARFCFEHKGALEYQVELEGEDTEGVTLALYTQRAFDMANKEGLTCEERMEFLEVYSTVHPHNK